MISRTSENTTQLVRESYDRLALAYARRFVNELQSKPLERELLNRFAASVRGRCHVCVMGCGPGHIARYLKDAGTTVFGLDLSPGMIEQARQLNPDISFQLGDMARENIATPGLADIVDFQTGDATEGVRRLAGTYDLILFDADRISAPRQLELLLTKLADRVFLLADNVISHPHEIADYLAAVQSLAGFTHVVVPVGKGLSVAFRDQQPQSCGNS